jgi:hypothetical protein
MSASSRLPDPNAWQRVDEFLAAVDRALAGADVSQDERRSILDDLRTQIAEMLADRAGDTPTLADVDVVLAEIDPPQAYAGPAAGAPDQPTKPGSTSRGSLSTVLRRAFVAWRNQPRYGPEQYAKDAQDALQYAEQEARHYNHEYLGTEHVLLGLLREKQGAAGKALRQLGVDLDCVRKELHTMIQPGPDPVAEGRLPHTPRMKQALEAALDKARDARRGPAGTEHLLFGLLAVPDGLASRLLTERFGLTADTIIRQAGLQP